MRKVVITSFQIILGVAPNGKKKEEKIILTKFLEISEKTWPTGAHVLDR